MLRELMNRIDIDLENDSIKTAIGKGMIEGALEGFVIVGLVHTVANVIDMFKK